MSNIKELNIFIDESGDCSPYSEDNPLYSIAFIMVEDDEFNRHALNIFRNQLANNEGGNHFVHTGNLVRAEKPYKEMLREKRQDLFYSLFLLAKYAKYKVCCTNLVKKGKEHIFKDSLADAIYEMIIKHENYLSKFGRIVLHYDNGQGLLSSLIIISFKNHFRNVLFVKTLQQDSAYMQIADLYSYFELIKYKILINALSKSEISFFGTARKIRKNYIEQLENKFL